MFPEPTELFLIGCLIESMWTPQSKSNTLTPKTNSQTYWQREISHVMNGIIFCDCSTSVISIPLIVLKRCRKERKKMQEKKVTAKSRPMMNLTARMPSVVSSWTSSSPGKTWYGYQDPGKSVVVDDRSEKPDRLSSTDFSKLDYDRVWSSQEWKSGEMLEARTERPVREHPADLFTQHRQICHRWRWCGLWHRHRIEPFAKITVILAQDEWSFAKDIGPFFNRCNDIPSKRHGKSHFQEDVRDIWTVDMGTIGWVFWSVSNQLGKFSMETVISGQWWRSHQSLARKGVRIFGFCVMSWKGELEPTIKYCLGRKVELVQRFTTVQNFGHNWRRADGIRVEKIPRIHHVQEQNGRTHHWDGMCCQSHNCIFIRKKISSRTLVIPRTWIRNKVVFYSW